MRTIIALPLAALLGLMLATPAHAVDYDFTVNLTTNVGDADLNDGFCDTNPAVNDQMQCTLRAAIQQANEEVPDTLHKIDFSVTNVQLDGMGLPQLTEPTVIDGGDGTTRVDIDGNGVGTCFSVNSLAGDPSSQQFLTFPQFNNTRFENLVIHDCTGDGIVMSGHGYVVYNSYIGTNTAGEAASGNGGDGIDVTSDAAENSIPASIPAGLLPDDVDEFVDIVLFIVAALPSLAPNAILDNVISGNDGDGILISGQFTAATLAFNNRIGTDKDAEAAIPNGGASGDQYGVRITGNAYANIIGINNVIAGNNDHPDDINGASGGVLVTATTVPFPNIITGNFIGTGRVGSAPPFLFPDLGNDRFGIQTALVRPTTAADVVSNPETIVNPTGLSVIIGPGNIVGYNGDTDDGDLNFTNESFAEGGIIVFNGLDRGVKILGNIVGISDGIINAIDLGNNGDGINVVGFDHVIGGDTLVEGNIVGRNRRHGVVMRGGSFASNNVVKANAIGTLPDFIADVDLGNVGHGIWIVTGGLEIGGASFDNERNTIGHNGRDGIDIVNESFAYGNHIQKNSIFGVDFASGWRGIDLKGNLIDNQADPTDNATITDRSTAAIAYTQWHQSTVTLTGGDSSGVTWELRSARQTVGDPPYRIEFYSGDENGPSGRTFVCEVFAATTNPDPDDAADAEKGFATGSAACAGGAGPGSYVTATVTDVKPTFGAEPNRPGFTMSVPINNTSEISQPLQLPDELSFTLASQPDAPESAGSVMIAVERVGSGAGMASANVVVTGGSAMQGVGADYVYATTPVTWNNGEVGTRTVSVTINDDMLDENNESITFDLQNPVGAVVGMQGTTALTILDNDAPPTISIGDEMITETEATQTLTFTATLSAASSFPVDVTYTTSNATAQSGSDYTAATGLMVTIPAGSTQATFDIDILGDLLDEADVETFNVTISATNTSVGGSDLAAVGTINDDDPLPLVSINDIGPLNEGDSGTTMFGFTLSIDTASARPVTVRVTTGNGADTAVAVDDYAPFSQLFTIPAGMVSVPVVVNVVGDTTFEPLATETFTLTLAPDGVQPVNGTILDATGIGTITNDDAAPVLPDLSIAKTHAGDFAQGQTGATYTITVSNSAAAPTDGTMVSVVDSLPAGLTATAIMGTGWTCDLPTLTCTRTDVLPINSSYPAITLSVNVAGGASTPQVNMATVSGGGDASVGNNSASDSTTITGAPASPDLSIAKTHAGNFSQGQTGATYTITVSNSAAAATDGTMVSVVDTLPVGLTATAIMGTGWTCDLPTLTCTRTDVLPINSSYPAITLTVNVAGNASTPQVNNVTVSGGGDTSAPNNTAMDSTVITPVVIVPDLSISKTHAGDFAQGQTGATYTITVSNSAAAPTDGTMVSVVDTLPVGLTATAITGTGWTCDLPTLTCTRTDVLPINSSYPAITLTVNVAGNASTPQVNTVTVSGGGDTSAPNNTAMDSTVITPVVIVPDLSISKTHAGNFTQGQVGASYTITVSNSAAAPTNGTMVSVVDTLPVGLTATAITGTGWTCDLPTLTCTRTDVLPINSSYPAITLTVNVAGNASTPQVNNVTVSGGGDTSAPNNTAMDSTVITPVVIVPDLSISKTHAGDFAQGQTGATYTITVSNSAAAPTDGTMVSVVDSLPAGLTATAIMGTGWTCDLPTLTCTRTDVLPINSSYPVITLTVNVAGGASTPQVNMATVSGGGDASVPNNSASDPTTITGAPASPDLSIAKTHAGNFSQGQTGATYTITVSNSAAAATDGTMVSVVDTLPVGLTATAISGTGWICDLPTLSCTRTDVLPINSSYPAITLTVNVAGNASTPQVNNVTVSGGGDTSAPNNTAMDSTVVTPVVAPDLSISKTHAGNFTQGQVGASYTITVANSAAAATNGTQVSVVDTLPTGLTATAISGTGWSCVLATLTCTRTDVLAASASYPAITLTVNVAGGASTPQVNMATVSGGGDASVGNNSANDPTTITGAPPAPDLSISKTHVGNFAQGQTGAVYTITVSNSAAAATNGTMVSVVDTLPVGLTATAISGTGWSCVLATLTCTRSDVLPINGSYPPITLTVNVAANAASPQVNNVTVSGGGDASPGSNAASDAVVVTGAAAGTLQFTPAPADQTVGEAAGTATFLVSRSGGSTGAVGVTITLGGSATNPADYSNSTTTLTWAAGDATDRSITFTLVDDALPEGNESITLTLTAPSGGATLGANAAATLTILDNDAGAGGQITPVRVPASSWWSLLLMAMTMTALAALTYARLPRR